MTTASSTSSTFFGTALLAAALSLPSVQFANADAPPERSVFSVKYLNYEDSQPGINTTSSASSGGSADKRVGVQAVSVRGMVPFASLWSLGSSYTYDSVSGASPAYHTTRLTSMKDSRRAADLQLARYFPLGNVSFGTSYSGESDYISRNLSLQGSISTADKNTTITLGGSLTNDTINPSNMTAQESKKIVAGLVGITRVLTSQDIVQLNIGYSKGTGYYSDPYKLEDNRPRDRNNTTAMVRWNHHFDESFTDGTVRSSYRYYSDTFGIKAHTLDVEYVQPVAQEWTVTPLLRFYSQGAADFYVPVGAAETATTVTPHPASFVYYTEDQRLAAFGAITLGLKVSKKIGDDWLVDVKYEHYEQRANWSLSSNKDAGLAPFSARSIQVGASRSF